MTNTSENMKYQSDVNKWPMDAVAVYVLQALDNAVANGYDLTTWSVGEIIDDLRQYDSVCERLPKSKIRPVVRVWKQGRKK